MKSFDVRLLVKSKFEDDGKTYFKYKYKIGSYTVQLLEIYHDDGNSDIVEAYGVSDSVFCPDIYFNERKKQFEINDPFAFLKDYTYYDGPYDYYDVSEEIRENSELYEEGISEAEQVVSIIENQLF